MKTMNKKKTTYRLYSQAQLKILSDKLCDQIEPLLHALDIHDYKDMGKMMTMCCPIHDGDNASAFNLYYKGDNYRGNWKCRTHQCEQTFKGSIVGFIRGCLSKSSMNWSKPGDDMCSFADAIKFAEDFLKEEVSTYKVSRKHVEKSTFVNSIKYINPTTTINQTNLVPRSIVAKTLSIPSNYFLNRGFSREILQKYDIGDCLTIGKEMNGRAVVPVYDNDYEFMVGCSGRSIYDRCGLCNSYHSGSEKCPSEDNAWKYSKWKHSYGFKSQEHLYNFWFAKKHIKNSGLAIIVESPGNVWRLEEAGIHNSVALFGSSLGDKQKMLLDISGAMNLITIMDNDEAGRKAAEQIKNKCNRIYNIKNIEIDKDDIACMSIADINDQITPLIKAYL